MALQRLPLRPRGWLQTPKHPPVVQNLPGAQSWHLLPVPVCLAQSRAVGVALPRPGTSLR